MSTGANRFHDLGKTGTSLGNWRPAQNPSESTTEKEIMGRGAQSRKKKNL